MLSHHAYYIEDSLARFDAYKTHLEDSSGYIQGKSLVSQYFDKFGIEDARTLIELASLKNTQETTLYFIGIASITSEAQQALLKLFEEPQEGTVFVLLVPHGVLLPTVTSRFLRYPNTVFFEAPSSTEAKDFLSWPYKKRSDWVASWLKAEEDPREHVRAFLNKLEVELYKYRAEMPEIRSSLEEIAHLRQYMSDKAPSSKMILEHFAATLPTQS